MSEADRQRWNQRYAAQAPAAGQQPNALALELAHLLPTEGRALDLAAGSGRLAQLLARRPGVEGS